MGVGGSEEQREEDAAVLVIWRVLVSIFKGIRGILRSAKPRHAELQGRAGAVQFYSRRL